MSNFNFKDLYVSLSGDQDRLEGYRGPQGRTGLTARSTQECTYLHQVDKLKAYLVQALAVAVDLENKVDVAPRSVAEIEMLEERLRAAMEELRIRKAELENEAA